jgi:hypothetical protein
LGLRTLAITATLLIAALLARLVALLVAILIVTGTIATLRTLLIATTLLTIVTLLAGLIATIIVIIIRTGTIATLRGLTLQSCTKTLRTEAALIFLTLFVKTGTFIVDRTLTSVNTWTGRTSYWTKLFLVTLTASATVHLLFFLFLFVLKIHNSLIF